MAYKILESKTGLFVEEELLIFTLKNHHKNANSLFNSTLIYAILYLKHQKELIQNL